jgi:hypothetical protein
MRGSNNLISSIIAVDKLNKNNGKILRLVHSLVR